MITHGPPANILDLAPGGVDHIGDPELWQAVQRIKPLAHIFGHAHGAYGQMSMKGTVFVNCAVVGLQGPVEHKPVILNAVMKKIEHRPDRSPTAINSRSEAQVPPGGLLSDLSVTA